MAGNRDYNFERYLSAKKAIDDTALNHNVLDRLKAHLPQSSRSSPLHILELGSGIGTMVERLVEWGLVQWVDYTAVDADEAITRSAGGRLERWSQEHGYKIAGDSPGRASIQSSACQISITFECADVHQYFEIQSGKKQWDLGVAHAFMDLVDPAETVPRFCQLIKPGGLIYLTLNYDAETVLLPPVDYSFDEKIMRLYNKSMDTRQFRGKKTGDSRAGRHLLLHLRQAKAEILAAGSSDWVVFPSSNGYTKDESYFLHFIVHTIFKELNGHASVDRRRLNSWADQRHAQVEKGELIFIAKQMDMLARISGVRHSQ